MIHIDLFSGIGGFSYAADQVWKNMEHVFCDIDPFARAVTKKHWPKAKHYADIKKLITDAENRKPEGLRLEREPQSEDPKVGDCYLVTGGFPCQPFSQAGRRRGTEDDRYLWPPMLRVVQLFHPVWVIAENVAGLVTWNNGMVLEQVCADLESEGYEVQPFIIPAVAVNAPHRRDRVWIVAHRNNTGGRTSAGGIDKNRQKVGTERKQSQFGVGGQNGNVGNTKCPRLEGAWKQSGGKQGARQHGQHNRIGRTQGSDWSQNWFEVAARLCRMDDGLPARMDGLELTKSAHRRERIKSLGNAIVPQVAIEIMRAIKETEDYA